MIDRLRAALAPADIALTPAELLDVLWLAQRIPAAGLGVDQAPADRADPRPASATGRPATPGATRAPAHPPHPLDLYAHTDAGSPGSAARVVRVRAERVLPEARGLARALRPLKRGTPSRHRWRLDEDATAELIAETGVLDLALRPHRERWLTAALVVDDGLSMELWRETAAALRGVLEGVGVFRTVRCYGLDSRREGRPVLRARPFSPGAPVVPPGSLCPPDGRGAILVLSDAIGAGWHAGRIAPLLAGWSQRCPTALLQPLPRRLWTGSALRAERTVLRAPRPGAANAELSAADPLLPELLPAPGLPVPVLDLQPAAVAAWAALVAGAAATLPTVLVPRGAGSAAAHEARAAAGSPSGPRPADLAGRLAFFRQAASPEAYRLAGHLAAIRPLTLGLMRLVQRAVHGRIEPAALAEVLLGGLMRRSGPAGGNGPARYDFRPGLRELLLETVPAAELLATADLVGEALRDSPPGAATLSVLRPDLAGRAALAPGASPFAASAGPLLRHFALAGDGPANGTRPGSDPWPDSGSGAEADSGSGAEASVGGPPEPDGAAAPLTDQDDELGALVAAQDWRAAVERGEEVLDRLLRRYGPQDLRVLGGRRELADWIGRAGAPQTAFQLAREVCAELERRLGPADHRTLAAAATAARWAGGCGRPAEAVDRFRSVLGHQEPVLGPDHPDCLVTLGQVCYWTGELGDPDATLRGYLDLLARQQRVLGPDDLVTLNTRANVASWTGQSGRTEEAMQLSGELLRDLDRSAPRDHPLSAITAAEHAYWTAMCGDPAAALRSLVDLLPRLTEALGPAHSYPYATRRRIAHWTGLLGDPGAALEQTRVLLVEVSAVLTPEHPAFLGCRVEFAVWTARTGDRALAHRLVTDLLPELTAVLGPDHPETGLATELLAEVTEPAERTERTEPAEPAEPGGPDVPTRSDELTDHGGTDGVTGASEGAPGGAAEGGPLP
ncbi:SAV_2336 N-terminal domain-related protein [Kitasatospora sp. NPDC057015]|uniref:SAV_2336 N-terminal domain-related protein n=1 Tax=Kitasatospora sp. NPDC057015 TaxID=3346001 RepID=UPI00363A8330